MVRLASLALFLVAYGLKILIVDRKRDAELEARGVELVCLAGYMRLLSSDFVRAFQGRIVNIHPSLLPSFKGLDAQRQAIVAAEDDGGGIHDGQPIVEHAVDIVRSVPTDHEAVPQAGQ